MSDNIDTTGHDLDDFTAAYITAMFWAGTDQSRDNGGDPLEQNYDIDDLSPGTLERIKTDCAKFQSEMQRTIEHRQFMGDTQAGHDFWLTRVGHGAGFWDGDWPEPAGARLTELAKMFGHVDVVIGDDGKIYLS